MEGGVNMARSINKDEKGCTLAQFNKTSKEYQELDLSVTDGELACLDMTIDSIQKMIKADSNSKYPSNDEGLNRFKNKTLEYVTHVRNVNANLNDDNNKKLVLDIEGWCCFLGISRNTLKNYSRRGGRWTEFIEQFKESILAYKKQLAFSYKIPPVIAMFDLVNNHGYINTNQVSIKVDKEEEERKSIEQELEENNIVWNEETNTFEGM